MRILIHALIIGPASRQCGCPQEADATGELPEGQGEEAADNGADAMHLLRALALQDPAVLEKVKSTDAAPARSSCCVM